MILDEPRDLMFHNLIEKLKLLAFFPQDLTWKLQIISRTPILRLLQIDCEVDNLSTDKLVEGLSQFVCKMCHEAMDVG